MFKRIDHVEIVTDQLDQTVQFYTEVLGFTVKARDRIERSGLGVPIDLVYLDLGGTVVELISYEGTQVDPAPQTEHLGYRMIPIEVDDMPKTANYLRTKGVDIVWGPRVRETYSRANLLSRHIDVGRRAAHSRNVTNRRVFDRAGGAREGARTDRRLPLSRDFIHGQLRASGRSTPGRMISPAITDDLPPRGGEARHGRTGRCFSGTADGASNHNAARRADGRCGTRLMP